MKGLQWGCLLLTFLLPVGCNRAGEEYHEHSPEITMIEEPPDFARIGTYLRIGLFKEVADRSILRMAALNQAEVERIVRRHIDRTRAGTVIRGKPPRDGNGMTLGFIEGIPIVLREEGEVHIPGGQLQGRLESFIRDLCAELGCSVSVQAVGGKSSSLIRIVPD
jgi:hypothetical protein